MHFENLTEKGKDYAERTKYDSIISAVALGGYNSGWPVAFIETAIKICNEATE